jgi:hypothetical protein
MDISWDISRCKTDPTRPMLINCDGLGKIEAPATTAFIATSMSTSIETDESIDVNAQVVHINLGLSTTGTDFMHYFISLPYDGQHCGQATGPSSQAAK